MRQVELIENGCGKDLIDLVNKRLSELANCKPSVQFVELYGNSQVVAYISYNSTLRAKK